MRHPLLNLCVCLAALAGAASPAFANKDIVQFGSSIRIEPNTTVHDTVCFFCSVDDRGEVDGDMVVFFGNTHITGIAHHDVVNFFGTVTVDDNATVGHDLVSMFGSVRFGQNASVGRDFVAMFGDVRQSSDVSIGGDRVVQPPWLFWGPLLILGLVIFLVVREYRNYRRRFFFRGSPYPPR